MEDEHLAGEGALRALELSQPGEGLNSMHDVHGLAYDTQLGHGLLNCARSRTARQVQRMGALWLVGEEVLR